MQIIMCAMDGSRTLAELVVLRPDETAVTPALSHSLALSQNDGMALSSDASGSPPPSWPVSQDLI
eukprot:525565-Rhodomonas_salina.2